MPLSGQVLTNSREFVALQVRLGTSDINVFVHVFRWGEYAWEFAESPRVIVDAGAYTGLSTAYFAMRYPAAKIIAIEPDEANFGRSRWTSKAARKSCSPARRRSSTGRAGGSG
jgi:hypothetical protein